VNGAFINPRLFGLKFDPLKFLRSLRRYDKNLQRERLNEVADTICNDRTMRPLVSRAWIAEGRRLPVQQVTYFSNHLPITPPTSPSFVPIILHRRVTHSRPRRSMYRHGLLTTVPPLIFVCEPLRSLTTRSASLTRCSPSPHFAQSLSRSFLNDPASRPFFLQHERTTCCSRAPPSGMRSSVATVRNSCCACVKN